MAQADLIPFQPGVSGNPKGGSKARSAQASFRRSVLAVMGMRIDQLPPAFKQQLDDLFGGEVDCDVADVIALRLGMIAMTGDPAKALAAMQTVHAVEAKMPEPPGNNGKDALPVIPETQEHMDAVAEALAETGAFDSAREVLEKRWAEQDAKPESESG